MRRDRGKRCLTFVSVAALYSSQMPNPYTGRGKEMVVMSPMQVLCLSVCRSLIPSPHAILHGLFDDAAQCALNMYAPACRPY